MLQSNWEHFDLRRSNQLRCIVSVRWEVMMCAFAEEVSDTLGPDRLPNANDYPSLQ